MRHELIVEILDKALTEELGIVVTCDNQHQTTLKFHAVTKDNPKCAGLVVCAGSKPNEVLIVQKTVQLDDAREPADE